MIKIRLDMIRRLAWLDLIDMTRWRLVDMIKISWHD